MTDQERPNLDAAGARPGDPAGGTTTQTPPPPPPRRRLTRRWDDRIIAGVGSGFAAYLEVDPALVRIGLVVLAFLGPGVPLYVAGWLLMPSADADEQQPAPVTHRSGPAFWIGVALLVVASLALADNFGFLGRDVLWPLVLIGVGVALWRVGQDRDPSPLSANQDPAMPSPDTPTQTPSAAAGSATTTATTRPFDAASAPPSQPPGRPAATGEPTWEPPPPPQRSPLGRITMAILLLTLGTVFLLDQADLLNLSVADVFAAALIVVGGGLVLGAWVGRARWLIAAGFVLLPFVLFASFLQAVDVPFGDGIGERNYDIANVAALRDEYSLGAGELDLDLRDLALDGRTETLAASVGAGQLTVRVPADVAVTIDAAAAIGELDLLDIVRDEGARLERTARSPGSEGAGELRLDLGVGAGQIVVERDVSIPPPAPLDSDETAPQPGPPADTDEPGAAPAEPAATTDTAPTLESDR